MATWLVHHRRTVAVAATLALAPSSALAQVYPSGPPIDYNSAIVTGPVGACTAALDRAIQVGNLTVTVTGTPARVANNARVVVGMACMPTMDPLAWRIEIAAASSSAAVAAFYAQMLPIWAEVFHGPHRHLPGEPPASAGGAAPKMSLCIANGRGPSADLDTVSAIATSIHMQASQRGRDGTILLKGQEATELVVSSAIGHASGALGAAIQTSYVVGFAESVDAGAARRTCDAVRTAMAAPPTPVRIR